MIEPEPLWAGSDYRLPVLLAAAALAALGALIRRAHQHKEARACCPGHVEP